MDIDKRSITADKVINLNKLRQLYLTYEVNNNKGLSDHAKMINNELLRQLKEEQRKSIKDNKVTPQQVDLFHENLIFNRKIGHSEIVYNWRMEFMGTL